jgi:DNA-directed RNA polymerases I and III subunit RPAC2
MNETNKFDILPGTSTNLTSATFVIYGEDHTLGNTLRHIIMNNPEVDFCGYTMPHPSEEKIHIRIQTKGKITAIEALRKGLNDLKVMTQHILESFKKEYDISPENKNCDDWTDTSSLQEPVFVPYR